MFYQRASTAPSKRGCRGRKGEEDDETQGEREEEETHRVAEKRKRGTGGQKTSINHNYNQRARKLHQVRPLWPRDSWLPASHENLSPNFGFLQGRCLSLLCIRRFFHGFSRVSRGEATRPRLRHAACAGSAPRRKPGIERRLCLEFAQRFLSR